MRATADGRRTSDPPCADRPPPDGVKSESSRRLFTADLTSEIVTNRYNRGARIITQPADGAIPAEISLLFLIHPNGTLVPVTTSVQPQPQPGDTLILLASPAITGSRPG